MASKKVLQRLAQVCFVIKIIIKIFAHHYNDVLLSSLVVFMPRLHLHQPPSTGHSSNQHTYVPQRATRTTGGITRTVRRVPVEWRTEGLAVVAPEQNWPIPGSSKREREATATKWCSVQDTQASGRDTPSQLRQRHSYGGIRGSFEK